MTAAGYTFSATAEIVGVPESKLRYWAQVGFVGPSDKLAGKQVFSFQDLVSVRAAKELVDRGFTPAEIRRALETVRSTLPDVDRPLDRVRVAFDGEALVVVDDGIAFEVTGQRLFAFGLGDLAERASAVGATPLAAARGETAAERSAYGWFVEGLRLERESEDDAAATAYRKAIKGDAGLAAAHTNLGAIAYRQGDLLAARASFDAALSLDPDQPEARYNLSRLLFEEGDVELAAAELRRVVQLAPDFADAHYNLASALERLGSKRQAREHLERFLALAAASGEGDGPWIDEARARLDRLG